MTSREKKLKWLYLSFNLLTKCPFFVQSFWRYFWQWLCFSSFSLITLLFFRRIRITLKKLIRVSIASSLLYFCDLLKNENMPFAPRTHLLMRSSRIARVHDCSWKRSKLATVLDSIPASSNTMDFEGRQMKNYWIKYLKNPKSPHDTKGNDTYTWSDTINTGVLCVVESSYSLNKKYSRSTVLYMVASAAGFIALKKYGGMVRVTWGGGGEACMYSSQGFLVGKCKYFGDL